MNKDKEKYQYPKEASPAQVGELARKFEEMRQMTGSDGRYDKPKPKKRVVEPVQIPEVLSVPHTQPIKKPEVPESNVRRPEILGGLTQRFTQERLQQGKILKQIDKELANERDRGSTFNREGEK